MTCAQVQKMLPGFLEGVLSQTENALIEKHLASCAACRAAFEEYRQAQRMLGALEEMEPPPGFARRVMARVEEEEGKRRGILRKLFYPIHIKVPVQAVAVVAVAVLAIQVYRTVEPEKRTAPPAAVTAAPEPKEETGKKEDLGEGADRPAKKTMPAAESETQSGAGAVKDSPATLPPASALPAETRLRKEEAAAPLQTPSGPAAARDTEKAEAFAAGKRAKMETKAAAPPPSREAASLQRTAPVVLALQTEDPAWAGEKVQNLLREIGGSRIEMSRLGEGEIITADLNPEKLPLLLDLLKSLGQMPEKHRSPETAAPAVSIRIEIFRR